MPKKLLSKKLLIIEFTEKTDGSEEFWINRGITPSYTDTMQHAIQMLSESYYDIIVINAKDNKFLSLIPIMRKATFSPIFIQAMNPSIESGIAAIKGGADFYLTYCSEDKQSVERMSDLMLRRVLHCMGKTIKSVQFRL